VSEGEQLAQVAGVLVAWRRQFEQFTGSVSALLGETLPQGVGVRVLDLGAGVGDPALRLASMLRHRGHVTACDAVAAFVQELAREASRRDLCNLGVCRADMHDLPFGPSSFDYVTARFALHAAERPLRALCEAHRVLASGGRAVYVAWGRAEQPLLQHTVVVPLQRAGGPRFADGLPGPFRFAPAGSLRDCALAAGFARVEEVVHASIWCWPGSAASLWRALKEVSAPLYAPLLSALPPDLRAELDHAVVDALRPYECGDVTSMPVEVRCAIATKA
jgi:SAM-dependent methyltransferase